MNPLALKLSNARWISVYTIPGKTVLRKGRHGLYHEMVDAAASVPTRFGCYAWIKEPDVVCYCGSFSKDYANVEFRSNLHGRLHNYLQNHGNTKSERKNTNRMVFDNVNDTLKDGEVRFEYLCFDSIEIGKESLSFDEYCTDPSLVKAVEQLLIASYRRIGQCEWNRD